ncbi:MAG: biopolymer transporter ExbD [Acidobacteria bacterium]|nr:biopolymer transporter ExbD [Acidobacteriota bacterium]MBI3657512.1 biopolymer transporter ExbD [Acidobacteriota bacterium]
MASRHSVPPVTSDINVTPMADVMLVLLIIFMITTPLLQPGVTVNLPKGVNPVENSQIDSENAVIVAVSRESNIYLGKIKVSKNDLVSKLNEKMSKPGSGKVMFIKGDTNVAYEDVVEVINLCRGAGVEKIGLITEKIKERR